MDGGRNGGNQRSPQPFSVFANYDSLRLQTYREGEGLYSRIRVLSIGGSLALRFDDVGYFNRVYAAGLKIAPYVDDIEEFYSGCPFACNLLTPSDDDSQELLRSLGCRAGWSRGPSYTWLAAPTERLDTMTPPGDIVVIETDRESGAAEQDRFLSTYLRAFEAEESRIPGAMHNMRHLFQHDSLRFLLATDGDTPVGVGMMYTDEDWTFFCAGATVPSFRHRGCHHALLAARVRLARENGRRHVCSWAATGSESQRHMMQAGLEVSGVTTSWVFRQA